ncbi:protein adenylyltransferase FICD-like [Artemia franciscana]|uniref:protein adenylyltransferase FICD-like n=1 Tax=Artemia franciscana TaxID=6661 RepID=UPI0032DA6165
MVKEQDEYLLQRCANKNYKSLIPPAQLTKDIFKKIEDATVDTDNHYIYNSASIEGNSFTLKEVRMVLEDPDIFNKNNWKPKEITKLRNAVNYSNIKLLKIDVNEIIGLKDALDYLRSILLKKEKKISEEVILKLHYHVLGRVNPKESGVYRRVRVTVGDHKCPHPRRVKSLMEKFYKWLNSDDARKLHPIKYAAMAHFKLVSIHPFVDGNGRVSRLLMNLILMKKNYPLVIIHRSKRSQYYQAIIDANLGDISSFIRFIAHETEESLDFILSAISPGASLIQQYNTFMCEMQL